MSDAPGDAARRKWIALGVLLALAAPLVAIALLSSDSGQEGGGLRVVRGPVQGTGASLVVYVEDRSRNTSEAAGGTPTVSLECLAADDSVVRRSTHPWPFTDTDQGTLDPHVHERLPQREADRVVRCRLAGTEGPLEGRVSASPG